jgi:hypothetical protein
VGLKRCLITLDQRQDVMLMAETVKNYLNSNRYTGEDWEGPRITIAYDVIPLSTILANTSIEQHWFPLV